MLAKYGLIGMGVLLLAAGARIMWLEGDIDDLTQSIKTLEAQKVACQLSQDNLKAQIERQNKSLDKFKEDLNSKNEALVNIEKKNQILQKDVQKKINEINQVQLQTCKDTINWMLKEAIENNEKFNTDIND